MAMLVKRSIWFVGASDARQMAVAMAIVTTLAIQRLGKTRSSRRGPLARRDNR